MDKLQLLSEGSFAKVYLDETSSNVIRTEAVDAQCILDDNIISTLVFTAAVEDIHGTPIVSATEANAEHVRHTMPFYGKTICKWCDETPFANRYPVIIEVLLSLAGTCEQMMQKGMQHIDIKPNNVLIKEDGGNIQTTLIDFNICTVRTTRQHAKHTWSTRVGTYAYSAPEVVIEEQPSNTSNVWSLGLFIPYMSYNLHPFRVFGMYPKEETQTAWAQTYIRMSRIFKGKMFISDYDVSHINPSLLKLYNACMRWTPKERPSMQYVRKYLEHLSGKTIPVHVHTPVTFKPRTDISQRNCDLDIIREMCTKILREDLLCRSVSLYDMFPWDAHTFNDEMGVIAGVVLLSYMMQGSYLNVYKPIYDIVKKVYKFETDKELLKTVMDVGNTLKWKCYFKPLDVLYLETFKLGISHVLYNSMFATLKSQTTPYTVEEICMNKYKLGR